MINKSSGRYLIRKENQPGTMHFSPKKLIFSISLLSAFILLYHGVIINMFRNWFSPWGSHGPLILAVSIYLIWLERREIRDIQTEPALFHGGMLFAVGCFVFFAGSLGTSIVIQQFSMVPFLLGAILLIGGTTLFKSFLLPVGYLVFLTSFIETLLAGVANYLQKITAWVATLILKLTGFSVFLESTVIDLPHISIEVVRACSGISHIVALLALAVPLAYWTQNTMIRRSVLVFSAIVIGVFANGLRVALIGIYALFNKGADLHGPYETLYVSFIFFFGLLALVLFSRMLNRKALRKQPEESGEIIEKATSLRHECRDYNLFQKQLSSLIVAGVIFAGTFGMVHFYTIKPVPVGCPLDNFSYHMAGFSGKDIDYIDERLRPFSADMELLRHYEDSNGRSAKVYIGYFEIQDRKRKIIDYRRAWMHEQVLKVSFSAGEKTVHINKTNLREHLSPEDVYFFYCMNGRVITNEYVGKFLTFINGLFYRRNNAVLTIISTQSDEIEIMPFIAKVVKAVELHKCF